MHLDVLPRSGDDTSSQTWERRLPDERALAPLGDHLGARRISFRLRYRCHLRRRTDDSGALGPERRGARDRDGRGTLRHRAGFIDRWVAGGSVRPQAHVAVDRCALHRLRGGVRFSMECRSIHRRALHRRHWHRRLHRGRLRSTSRRSHRRPTAGDWRGCSSSTSYSESSSRFSRTRCSPASAPMHGAGCSASRRSRRSFIHRCVSPFRRVRDGCSPEKATAKTDCECCASSSPPHRQRR